MSQRSQARVYEPARDGPLSSGPSVNSHTGAKVDSVAEYAARLVSLRRVNIDSPGDSEFVREPADVGSPRLLRQRHLDPAAFGKCVEDLGEAGFICAAQYDSHVVADFSRLVRVAVRGDNDSALGLKSRISDAILGTRRLG